MVELVDTQDLGSCAVRRVGSNPTTRTTPSRTAYRSRRLFFKKSSLAHSVAPPLQTEPAALGFGLVLAANLKAAASIVCRYYTSSRTAYRSRRLFSKVISHSFRRSSSPNATRCAGLALVVSRVRLIPLHQHSREAGTAFTPYRRAYRPSLPEKQ